MRICARFNIIFLFHFKDKTYTHLYVYIADLKSLIYKYACGELS